MHHYTYILTANNPTDDRKYYIGSRSCKSYPTDDTAYLGSCRTFNTWQKEYGTNGITKQILAIWPNRELALDHEIRLHELFDVAVNEQYWNRAKQTSVKFNTAGTTHRPWNKGRVLTDEQKRVISERLKGHETSEETKQKISVAQKGKPKWSDADKQRISQQSKGRRHTEETKNKMSENNSRWAKGKTFSEEHRAKLSAARKGKSPWNKGVKVKESILEKMRINTKHQKRNERGQFI